MKTKRVSYLLFDVDNLSHRNWHAMQNVNIGSRVIVGMIRDIITFTEVLGVPNIAFCFDSGNSLRKKAYPEYKANRHYGEAAQSIDRQIQELRKEVLPAIGFMNLFSKPGYEADDLIGFLTHKEGFDFVIVSNDQDYYQLLQTDRVTIWDPMLKKQINRGWVLLRKKVLSLRDLLLIKAISGCKTDNIKGVCGEMAAHSYITGKSLRPGKKATIERSKDIIERNRSLIKLPYDQLPYPSLKLWKDRHTEESWRKVTQKYNCFTMSERYPWRNHVITNPA